MITDKLKQDILQVVYDKVQGVLLPEITPEVEAYLLREVERSAQYIENRLRTSLSPARYTNLPKTVQEAYENRAKYKDAINESFYQYPKWEDLTDDQKNLYGNNPSFYAPGTLPFNLLTTSQLQQFASNVKVAPNKIGDAERQDGKGTPVIITYYAPIINVYSLSLAFTAPPGYEGRNLFFRMYRPNEFYFYRTGEIHIFPAVMARILTQTISADPLWGSQYGPIAPRIPQVIVIDYEFGYTDENRPFDLLEAVALRTAMQLILAITAQLTAGLKSFSIEGFNASFGGQSGLLYENLYTEYEKRLRELLLPYYRPVMTAW